MLCHNKALEAVVAKGVELLNVNSSDDCLDNQSRALMFWVEFEKIVQSVVYNNKSIMQSQFIFEVAFKLLKIMFDFQQLNNANFEISKHISIYRNSCHT